MSYLFAAYTVTWILLFLYIFGLSRKQKKIDEDLATLRKMVERQE